MAVDAGGAVGYLDLDISGFLAGLKTAQKEADAASRNMTTKFGNSVTGIGKQLTSVGSTLTKNVTLPLVAVGTAGLKVATDFEKGMSQVKAISGATGKDFEALREKAIELGADTSFSANEVAEAMTEMAKAGWDSQQIIDGMSGVLAAAAASGENLSTVSTIVADTITGFGLAAADSTKVADLLTQAANSGTIGISDLGESFKYVAPLANAMGISVEDAVTAITAMSMAGIKGSQAGTALSGVLSRLNGDNEKVRSTMKELGIEITNVDGSFKSLDDIVAALRNSFSGMTDEQKAYYATILAGQEGQKGLLALLNLSEDEYNKIAESMDNAGGVAEKTAAIMQDNLQSKIEQLGGALESLAIKLADYVVPYLQKLVEWLTNVVDKFTSLSPGVQKAILVFAGIAAAIGPVIFIAGNLITSFGSIISVIGKIPGAATKVVTAFKNIGESIALTKAGFPALGAEASKFGALISKVGALIGGITAPIAAVIAIVAALVAAFVTLWKTNEDFRNKIKAIWDEIVGKFKEAGQKITDEINSLGFNFKDIVDVLKSAWLGLCNFIGPIFIGLFKEIGSIIMGIVDIVTGVVQIVSGIIKGFKDGDWSLFLDGLKTLFTGFINLILAPLKGWFETFKGYLEQFGVSWEESWEAIKNFFKSIWDGITSFLSSAWETIKNVVQAGIMFIVELVKGAFTLITLPFMLIWENCKGIIKSAWESIKTTVSEAINKVKETIIKVWTAVETFFTTIWQSISHFISFIWDPIKTNITNTINVIKSVITNVFNDVKSTVTNIWNSIKSTATSIWNNIKSAITGPINSASSTVSSTVNSMKTTMSDVFNKAKSTVENIFNSIKNSISNKMNEAKTAVSNAIQAIKDKFNFTWSLPPLKLPHIKISGSFSLFPPSVPKFSVEWYKKAMSNGMILDAATIFGFNLKTGKFLGGGEAGSETIVGTKNLLSMIRKTVYNAIGPLVAAGYELTKATNELGYVTYNGFMKLKEVKEEQRIKRNNNGENGDTFVFYSPKAIDEIEAAKQMKKTKQDMAEGF